MTSCWLPGNVRVLDFSSIYIHSPLGFFHLQVTCWFQPEARLLLYKKSLLLLIIEFISSLPVKDSTVSLNNQYFFPQKPLAFPQGSLSLSPNPDTSRENLTIHLVPTYYALTLLHCVLYFLIINYKEWVPSSSSHFLEEEHTVHNLNHELNMTWWHSTVKYEELSLTLFSHCPWGQSQSSMPKITQATSPCGKQSDGLPQAHPRPTETHMPNS